MHKDALTFSGGALNKLKDLFSGFVLRVKEDLVLAVHPEVCQVDDSNGLPMVSDLLSCAIYDVSHFISNNEFQILKFFLAELQFFILNFI